MTAHALIAFGSNLGDPQATYNRVQQMLNHNFGLQVVGVSHLIETDPVGGPDQARYANGALLLDSDLSPQSLHARLIEIENELGRERRIRWGPRTVDLDLLLFDDAILAEKDLIVPHPRMSFRRFVLEPAASIAANMIHPTSQLTIRELLTRINGPDNDIVWFTDGKQDENKRRISDDLEARHSGWQFYFVDGNQEWSGNPQRPKLFISEQARYTEVSGLYPLLCLIECTDDQMRAEISAAITALEKSDET